MKEVFISEIFKSFQGESTYTGRLTSFIRFSECNLTCTLCDTKYSWKKQNKISYKELDNILNSLNTPYWCITGGEPLLQKEALEHIINKAKTLNIKTSIETNGSIEILKNLNTKWIIDVKTPSTGESASFNIKNLELIDKESELKFLISNKEDFEFSKSFIIKNNLLKKDIKILFSPNLETDMKNNLINLIVEWGEDIIFQPQLHKLIKEKPIYIINKE